MIWSRYALNDNLMPDVMHALWLAADVYGDERHRAAAKRAADFLHQITPDRKQPRS